MSGNRLKKIEQKFIRFISQNKLISENDKILVAFSGGADSAFVLSLLKKYENKFKITVAAAHVNHGLRGAEAERDEKHCAEFAARLGAEFFVEKVNVKRFAKKEKFSTEEAARILRYNALEKIAKKIGANKIATAHNLNDNAETVLLNLLKGGGTRAVAGIPIKRDEIIRPALAISREEIEYWLEKNDVPFVEDSTNFENDYLRNRLRNLIFPTIRNEINPKAEEAIFNFSQILRAQNEIVELLTESRAREIFSFGKDTLALDFSALTEIDKLNFGNLLRYALRRKFSYDADFTDVEKIRALAENQKGKRVALKDELQAVREASQIIFRRKNAAREVYAEFTPNFEFETPQAVISVLKTKRKKRKKGCEIISADELDGKFVLRNWRAGDRFKPLGMKRTKKISDFLTDEKIATEKRKSVLVLENKGKIIWVVGMRISDDVKITENTKTRLELCVNIRI
jgi:tRNA(Ile)-lysidine synthase